MLKLCKNYFKMVTVVHEDKRGPFYVGGPVVLY